jgi:hypothetical protein
MVNEFQMYFLAQDKDEKIVFYNLNFNLRYEV